jgi:benzil reductase ((S)-benzoin forming)
MPPPGEREERGVSTLGETTDTLVWISGATSGIGAALARTCPYEKAEIINLSRRPHADLASVTFDLTRPETWDAVCAHFTERLAEFHGRRAVFIHNAFHYRRAFAGEGPREDQFGEVMANVAAPLVLGDAFLRASRPAVQAGVDVGLVQMSSAAARLAYPALAVYGAGKAAMEQWVRGARSEVALRGSGPWIVAVRPGFVDTPAARKDAALPAEQYPAAPALAESLATGQGVLDADAVAAEIWAGLPPTGDHAVLWFGEAIGASGPA